MHLDIAFRFGYDFGNFQIGNHSTLITRVDNVAIHNYFSDGMTTRDFFANLKAIRQIQETYALIYAKGIW